MQPTSLEAYEEVKKSLGHRHALVLANLESAGPVTNSELAHMLEWSINRITGRVFELRQKGLVVEHEKRKCRVTGHPAIAWRVKRMDEIKERQMEMEM